jgi:hypothetical protein
MRRCATVLLAALTVLAIPRPAAAWGFEAHKFIMARAIALLPAEIRPFFKAFETSIVEHVIDPDLWRTAGWLEEPPRHFLDLDAYGTPPFKDLPRDYDGAVARYGLEFVQKNGTVPWRAEEIHRKLVEAFAQKAAYSRNNIKFFSSVIGHYAADAHVPFHAARNYDGQLTGQWGIHARFESELFDRYASRMNVSPGSVISVGSPRDFIFDVLVTSFSLVQPVLDADKAAVAGRQVYDDGYFEMFYSRVQPILEKRLSDSITAVGSMITAAWIEAGRPALPLEVRREPAKVRRQ